MPKGRKPTVKQKKFVDEYLKNGGNARKAARDAGYSESTVQLATRDVLSNPLVKDTIAKKQAEIDKRNGTDIISLAEIQKIRADIAKGNIKDDIGFTPDMSDRLKACDALEKTMLIKEQEEQKRIDKENAQIKTEWHMPITDITSDFVEPYRVIQDVWAKQNNIREIISKGGRGSIKSNFWAALTEETIYNDPQAHAVYTRRYKIDLRGSVYNQFMKTVIRHGNIDLWEFKTSPMMAIYKKTGQCVIFVGADKPISLKSYNLSFGYVKLLIHEECDEMAGVEQMDNIEDTFLRSDTPALDIKIFNPPKSAQNFMNLYAAACAKDKKSETYICHSYYYNVPIRWLGQRFFDRAEWFKAHKPKYYDNNYLGKVTGTGGAIFDNVEIRTITDAEIDTMPYFNYGLDFGYEHPQTFEQSYYDDEHDILYCVAEQYSKRCKNSSFARKIKQYMNVEIICDSARPDSIAEMRDWGFDAVGAKKRWGSGKGRDYCWEWLQQTTKIVVDPDRCPNLMRELTTLEHEELKGKQAENAGQDEDGNSKVFSDAYPTLGEDCVMALIYGNNRIIMESRRNSGLYDDGMDDTEDEE